MALSILLTWPGYWIDKNGGKACFVINLASLTRRLSISFTFGSTVSPNSIFQDFLKDTMTLSIFNF